MKKTKKVMLSALIAGFILAVMFSGCSSNSENSSSEALNESSGQAAKLKLNPYEISWYFMGPNEQKDTEIVENEINKYLEDKINATVKLNLLSWNTYRNKIKTMIAAGQPFDICFTSSWMNDYINNSQNGAFISLDHYFKKELAQTKALLGADFLNASKINGKNYAIPANKEKARCWGFVYNKTLADKYNLDMSKVRSFDDMEPLLRVIKEKEPGVMPLHWEKHGATSLIPWNHENAMNSGEVTAITPEGKVVDLVETPEVKAAYESARRFYNAGYYRKDLLTSQDGPVIRKKGSFFAFLVNLKPGYAEEQQAANPGAHFELAQREVTDIVMNNADTMGSMQAISITSKDPRRAAMFLELVNTDKYLSNLINYGIEGKHYVKKGDNIIQPIKDTQYAPNMQWMFGNQFLTYLYANENPKKWEIYDEFNKKAKPAVNLGFIFNKEPVANELAACADITKEYHEALNCGAVDPAVKLPEFIAKLKAAGVDRIVAEEQRQFDAWRAGKMK